MSEPIKPLDEKLPEKENIADELPPLFNTWNQLYVFVLVLHALIIFLFYQLTQAYS